MFHAINNETLSVSESQKYVFPTILEFTILLWRPRVPRQAPQLQRISCDQNGGEPALLTTGLADGKAELAGPSRSPPAGRPGVGA